MIDDKTQRILRQKFNPDGSDLRKAQLRMLEMLKYIDRICKDNNIPYWLSSGTCLGAVRHGGFIPWDDDLDVEMLWTDYQKFVNIVNSFKGKDGYIVQTADNDPYYFYSYGKLRDLNSEIHEVHGRDKKYKYRGYFIDIFPIEPAGSKLFHKIMASLLNRVGEYTNQNYLPIFISKQLFYKCIFKGIARLNRLVLSIQKDNRYRHILGHGCPKIRMINEIFPLLLVKFEDQMVPIPNNSDAYLQRFYGNYNEIPSVDKIIPHTIEANESIKKD